jgi:hypothetical protein
MTKEVDVRSQKATQDEWNGAEQLFQAAKDYGITTCFANPGALDAI